MSDFARVCFDNLPPNDYGDIVTCIVAAFSVLNSKENETTARTRLRSCDALQGTYVNMVVLDCGLVYYASQGDQINFLTDIT